jgi:HAD superfamily hydrolase (TIGR01509 family)
VTSDSSAGPDAGTPWPFDAVLWDMDGSLVETESIWFQAERDVVSELGGEWLPEHQELFVGGPLDGMIAHMLELTGSPVAPEQVLERVLRRMVELLTLGPVRWMPGARELVVALRERGVPLVLVSASLRPMVDAVLVHVDRDGVAVSVSGDDVESSKPHPEPYLRAAALVDADPARCLAVEDSPTGVTSALEAGCTVLAVPSLRPIEPGDRVHVRSTLAGVTLDDLAALAPR